MHTHPPPPQVVRESHPFPCSQTDGHPSLVSLLLEIPPLRGSVTVEMRVNLVNGRGVFQHGLHDQVGRGGPGHAFGPVLFSGLNLVNGMGELLGGLFPIGVIGEGWTEKLIGLGYFRVFSGWL